MFRHLALVLAAVVVLVPVVTFVVCLVQCLRLMVKQMTSTNEKLMVLVGTRDGGEKVGRALVASQREPKKDIPGVVKDPPQREEVRPTGKPYNLRVGSI